MNDAKLNMQAINLQMKHNLRPAFTIRAGGGGIYCHLVHGATGEYKFGGGGNSQEEAFARAYEKFETAPDSPDAKAVQAENENLREQLAAMESKLEDSTPDALEANDSNGSTSDDADGVAEAPVKKTRRKRKSSSSTPF